MADMDSVKQGVIYLKGQLGLNDIKLANLLGVTERSLNDWKERGVGEIPPKAYRLKRLYEVVSYLQSHHTSVEQDNYYRILLNGRVTIDPDDAEEGTISLIGYINAAPKALAYADIVDAAIRDYFEEEGAPGEVRKPISVSP